MKARTLLFTTALATVAALALPSAQSGRRRRRPLGLQDAAKGDRRHHGRRAAAERPAVARSDDDAAVVPDGDAVDRGSRRAVDRAGRLAHQSAQQRPARAWAPPRR